MLLTQGSSTTTICAYARSLLLRSAAVVGRWWTCPDQFLPVRLGGRRREEEQRFPRSVDADASSPHYGQVVASVAVPGPSGTPHHTELEMPEGDFLLANAFESGRTMLFDLRDPLHPLLVTSFGDLDG